MNQDSSMPPAWPGERSRKARGVNPKLVKLLDILDAGRDSLAHCVRRLREANDRLEDSIKK